MRIGIASPVTMAALLPYLDPESAEKSKIFSGMKAPAVDALISGFLQAGHEVVVFTLDLDVKRPEILTGKNLKVYIGKYRRNGKGGGYRRAATFFSSEIKQLRSFICQEAAELDVLHAHWSYEYAIAGLGSGLPLCVTFRDFAPAILKLRPDFYRFMRLLMNRYVVSKHGCYQAVANSHYMSSLLKGKWGLDSVVIPNPIHPDGVISEADLPEFRQSRRIISISNGWGQRKNIETLLAAFALLRKELPEAELELIGGCFHRGDADTEKVFQNHPEWTENVIFAGHIQHSALSNEIRKSALLMHPSREESFGNILLEAMGQGVPVIGGRFSGAVPDVLDHGNAGVLCDINDPEAIKNEMLKLLSDDDLWRQYSRAGYRHLKENFMLDKIISLTLDMYERTIAEKNGETTYGK